LGENSFFSLPSKAVADFKSNAHGL